MACKIADNQPLQRLRTDLGLPFQCHSSRAHCAQGQNRQLGNFAMGGSGAAIGYCQALFNRSGSPDVHTRTVIESLLSVDAPWSNSHELFWGYNQGEGPSTFLEKALAPLAGTGRAPVLITGLDPATDSQVIYDIVETKPPVFPGESILIRIVLNSDESVIQGLHLITHLLEEARRKEEMPLWWPLFQADFNSIQPCELKPAFGDAWQYVNIAVNPFTPGAAFEDLFDQITVAQFVIGLKDGMHSDGQIALPSEMKIFGASENTSYNLFRYSAQLQGLPVVPTCILLGPASATWTLKQNCERVHRFLQLFKGTTEILWQRMSEVERDMVWKLPA